MTWGHSSHAFFFFNDTATTEIYTLSLHDALPIYTRARARLSAKSRANPQQATPSSNWSGTRSEEHTSELQSRQYLVCRLLLEKKKNQSNITRLHDLRERMTNNCRRAAASHVLLNQ